MSWSDHRRTYLCPDDLRHLSLHAVSDSASPHEKGKRATPRIQSRRTHWRIDYAAAGALTLIIVFWIAELLSTGITGHSFPGATESRFAPIARRAIYETIYFTSAKTGHESQAAAFARSISNPSEGISNLKDVLETDAVQNALKDDQFARAVQEGNPEKIKNSRTCSAIFSDEETHRKLIDLGVLSRTETKDDVAKKLAHLGQNDTIRFSIKSLTERGMFQTDRISELIRDPEFDKIVTEILKK